MIERKKAALIREDTSRNVGPQSSQQFCETYPSHVTSQWSTVPVQPSAFWDGNVQHYVVPPPSMEQFQSSPSFVSAQHSSPADSPPFQFSSSSLSAALASPQSLHDSGSQASYPAAISPSISHNVSERPLVDVEHSPQNTYPEQDMVTMDVIIDFDFHADAPSADATHAEHTQESIAPIVNNNAEQSDSGESERPSSPCAVEQMSSPVSPIEEGSSTHVAAADPSTSGSAVPDALRHYRQPGRKAVKPAVARKVSGGSTRPPPRLSANLPAAAE